MIATSRLDGTLPCRLTNLQHTSLWFETLLTLFCSIKRSHAFHMPTLANTHVQLRYETGIPYNEMLFFDDSNYDPHTTKVPQNCKGVVAVRTPHVSQSTTSSPVQ